MKFKKGDKVQLSPLGLQRISAEQRLGVVVGFGREPHIVAVLLDGLKTRGAYHMDFWEKRP